MQTEHSNNTVYLLHHVYETEQGEDEVKLIGVFSSEREAKEIAKLLYKENGFKNYPFDCFEIEDYVLNEYSWKEGFRKWSEDGL